MSAPATTYAVHDHPISIYLNGAADNVTGSSVAETIHGEYVAGPVTINGGGGNDSIIGSASGDTRPALPAMTLSTVAPATIRDRRGHGHDTQTVGGWTVVSADGTDT